MFDVIEMFKHICVICRHSLNEKFNILQEFDKKSFAFKNAKRIVYFYLPNSH